MKTLAFAAFAVVTMAGSAAAGQTPAAPTGPAIPGICFYHHDRLLAVSTAGQSLITGIQRLQQEVDAELSPYAQHIQTEGQALQQGRGSIPQDQFVQREQALAQRIQEGRALQQQRDNEIRYTLAVQRQTIEQAADPIITALYAERGCGILFRAESVMHANPQMDITDAAIQRLNTALPTLPAFNRMTPPVQQQQ